MRHIICDRCGHTGREPLNPDERTFHKVVLRVDTRYHVGVTIVQKEWCGDCIKKTLGTIPEPMKDPPPKSQQLFDELVEAVAEKIRDDA